MKRWFAGLFLACCAATSQAFISPPSHLASTTTRASSSSTSLRAVAKKDSYSVTLLPGDGIGPEIMAATVSLSHPPFNRFDLCQFVDNACDVSQRDVLQEAAKKEGFKIDYTEALIGGAAIDATGEPFPDSSLHQ